MTAILIAAGIIAVYALGFWHGYGDGKYAERERRLTEWWSSK